jgi:hypothetical protein
MRPVTFREALSADTRLILLSADKPDRFFTVIKFWIDKTSGVALELNTGVPSYHVDDGLPRRSSASAGPAASQALAGTGRRPNASPDPSAD